MSQKENTAKVVTRFAPSPTGNFHVGGIRSALYNYLFARHHGGTYILRSEDTDKERSKKEYEDGFLEVFRWLGLEHDAFYRQSDRTELYKNYIEKMLVDGTAYVSKEEVVKEGQRAEVIRLKNPNKKITFTDLILGDITVDTTDLGDFVIARDVENPLYHLTVVIDDYEMEVTHVIRGQEHVSNTARQILIQEAIGTHRPLYAHIPLILGKDKSKLSKRDPEVVPAIEYRDMGYLPEALLNFMALIGWNPGGEQEIFSLGELVELFDLEKVHKGGGVFNVEKLNWINKEHIKKLSLPEQKNFVQKFLTPNFFGLCGEEKFDRLFPTLIERISYGAEITDMEKAGELGFVVGEPTLDLATLNWNGKQEGSDTKKYLEEIFKIINDEPDWMMEPVKEKILAFAGSLPKRGAALHPLRYGLTGLATSPDPFTVMYILGQEESLSRIQIAIDLL